MLWAYPLLQFHCRMWIGQNSFILIELLLSTVTAGTYARTTLGFLSAYHNDW